MKNSVVCLLAALAACLGFASDAITLENDSFRLVVGTNALERDYGLPRGVRSRRSKHVNASIFHNTAVVTPPMCFVHGDADGWAAMNSVKCWEKLRSMGIQGDLNQ